MAYTPTYWMQSLLVVGVVAVVGVIAVVGVLLSSVVEGIDTFAGTLA